MDATPLVILIVDHSPGNRLLVRQLLARTTLAPIVVREAAPDDPALADAQQSPPDCVLLDQKGLASLKALRTFSDMPIVLLSDIGAEALALEALQHGAQDYLVADELNPGAPAAVYSARHRDRPPRPRARSGPNPPRHSP